jgi:hypothetical protein
MDELKRQSFGLRPKEHSGADDSSGTSMSYTGASLAGLAAVAQPAPAGGTSKASREAFKRAIKYHKPGADTGRRAWCAVSAATNMAHGESLPTTPGAWVAEAHKAIATLVPPGVFFFSLSLQP